MPDGWCYKVCKRDVTMLECDTKEISMLSDLFGNIYRAFAVVPVLFQVLHKY